MYFCTRGHDVRGPRDMLPGNNKCRQCDREDQARYHERRRLAMSLLKQMEAAGLKATDLKSDSGYAIGLAWANAADDEELARIEREHPALIAKVRNRIQRIEAE